MTSWKYVTKTYKSIQQSMGLIVPILLGLSPPEPGVPEPRHGCEETCVHPPGLCLWVPGCAGSVAPRLSSLCSLLCPCEVQDRSSPALEDGAFWRLCFQPHRAMLAQEFLLSCYCATQVHKLGCLKELFI